MYAASICQQEQEQEQAQEQAQEQYSHVFNGHTAMMRRKTLGEGKERPVYKRVVCRLGITIFTQLTGLVDNAINFGECRRLTQA